MSTLDLNIIDIFHGDTPVVKVMKGDVEKWPLYDAEIEYIESSRGEGCYIDTGVYITSSTYVNIRYGISKLHSEAGGDVRYLFGYDGTMGSGYAVSAFLTGSNTVRTRWGKSSAKDLAVAKNDILTFIVNNGRYINVNERSGGVATDTIGTTFPTNYPFKLLAMNSGRIYHAVIGNLDLIPVRKGQVGYMYDRNSRRLFAKQGSGDPFILGPDK